jgi:hypothetical protein
MGLEERRARPDWQYHLPARCFAYVGSAADPRTWHLPYLHADGTPDLARLPKAIQAILSNYRGAHFDSVPEAAIPEVLITLARTAHQLGKLPASGPSAARTSVQLQEAWNKSVALLMPRLPGFAESAIADVARFRPVPRDG